MNHSKRIQFLFVGQSQNVSANLQTLVQAHAQSIFSHKENTFLRPIEFTAVTSQRQALQIVRGIPLDIILLETGASNGDRRKFAETIRKQQPVARLIEVGNERAKSPHPFNSYVRLPLDAQQALEALRRCARPGNSHLIPFGHFVLDSANDLLISPDCEISLRPMESKLLAYLIENRGNIVKRTHIMRHVWGTEYYEDTRTLDVHIRQLRKHLEANPSQPEYLITERGRGYVLKV